MSDRLDDMLRKAADPGPEPTPGSLERITARIAETLVPVRPLAPVGLHVLLLAVICVCVAILGAGALGMGGLHKLSAMDSAIVLSVLGVLMTVAAFAGAGAMRPGRARLMPETRLLALICAVVILLFAGIFVHYGSVRFVPQGLICLKAGLIHAAVAALIMGLVLRRCYAVDPKAAGTVIGTLAGFAGVIMLELHCTDFQAQHVLVWHTAVLPCSALLGRVVGGTMTRWTRSTD